MKKAGTRSLTAAVVVLGMVLLPLTAFGWGRGNPTHLKHHPRVDQVNRRFQNQAGRIKAGEKSGKISQAQAKQLYGERKAMKQEEHTMRKADDGHLTKADQKALNQQENQRSQQIYQEKH